MRSSWFRLLTVVGIATFAIPFCLAADRKEITSGYFEKVEDIEWIDCKTNVPSYFAEQNDLKDNKWPAKATPIPKSLKCGKLAVPLDYDKPFGNDNSIKIAFTLVTAKKSKGLLVYNPGGPASEAQSVGWTTAFMDSMGREDGFTGLVGKQDLLFYDTRGVGESTHVECDQTLLDSQPDSWFTTPEEFDEIKAWNKKFGDSCIRMSKPEGLIKHIGTEEIIRDWNSIRIALGYDKFNYLGVSYGTWYGVELASGFPKQQGRFVFDGVAAHGQPDLEQITTDLNAMNRLLLRSDAWCIANSTCPFHDNGKGAVPKVFKEMIHTSPQNYTKDLRDQFRGLMTGNPQFSEFNSYLSRFQEQAKKNFADWDQESDSSKSGKTSKGLSRSDYDGLAFQATTCADEDVDDPTFEGFQKIMKDTTGDDPDDLVQVAFNWAIKLGCVGWPVKGRDKFKLPNDTPNMWVTSDFDLNTPTEQTTTAFKETPKSIMVIRHGDNHGTASLVDQPAQDLEISYLAKGILPRETDKELVTVIGPGDERPSIDDPYEVPVGEEAGDDDSVDEDAKDDKEEGPIKWASKNYAANNSSDDDDGRNLKPFVIGLGAAAGALLLLFLGTLVAFIRQRRRISGLESSKSRSAPSIVSGSSGPAAYPFLGPNASQGHLTSKGAFTDPYSRVSTKDDNEDEKSRML